MTSMLTAEELRDLRTSASDWEATEEPKATLGRLKAERLPFYLTSADFDLIFRWKFLS
ncbi:MAG: hypothetical protein M1617_03885 [Actinobacteria bacterium]|nr:hypothetical protein [Actinomycetota bacterium]MCL5887431.1 hypothetical protein [Actinomycetota bacterium]